MSRLRVELCCEVLIAQYPQMKSMQRTSAPAVRHGHYPEDGSRGRKMELWQTMRKLAVLRCQEYHHGSKLLRPWAAPPCLPQPNPADRRIGQKKLLLQPILQDIRQVIDRNNQTCHTYYFSRLFQGFSDSPNFTTMWQTSCNRGQFYCQ